MVLKDFIFFDENSQSTISDPFKNINGKTMIVQVDTDSECCICFYGKAKDGDINYILSIINANDYNISTQITTSGLYYVYAQGVSEITAEAESGLGTVTVYGKLVD